MFFTIISVSGCVAAAVAIKRAFKLVVFLNFMSRMHTADLSDAPEFRDGIDVTVSHGTLPPWLTGIMYRVGPGKYKLRNEDGKTYTMNHAFDGMPYVHRFEISGVRQQVRYSSRHIAEKAEKTIVDNQGIGEIFFAHIPQMTVKKLIKGASIRCKPIFRRRTKHVPDPSSRMIGVTTTPNYPLPEGWAAKGERVLVTKTDANMLEKIHADSLEPQQLFDYNSYNKDIKGHLSAAHHQYDPHTKECFNFVLDIGSSKYTLFKIDPVGETTILTTISRRLDAKRTPIRPAYIHGFWLTKDYIILPEMPLYYNKKGLHLLLTGSVVSGFRYNDQEPTYLHIISRIPGQGLLATIPVEPFFMFHPANAWNTSDEIVLDGSVFSNGDIVHMLQGFGSKENVTSNKDVLERLHRRGFFKGPKAGQTEYGKLRRIVIRQPLSLSPSVNTNCLADNFEFPRFSQSYALKPYRYVYGTAFLHADGQIPQQSIIKVDTHISNTIPQSYAPVGCQCSEPIFVPRPGEETEDDGVILSFVSEFYQANEAKQPSRCYLVVLDAKNLTELARCDIGDFTATTFHGSFVDDHFENVSVN